MARPEEFPLEPYLPFIDGKEWRMVEGKCVADIRCGDYIIPKQTPDIIHLVSFSDGDIVRDMLGEQFGILTDVLYTTGDVIYGPPETIEEASVTDENYVPPQPANEEPIWQQEEYEVFLDNQRLQNSENR